MVGWSVNENGKLGFGLMNHFDPHKHHRRSIRLPGWDYRTPGFYFVTICTYQHEYLFENEVYFDIAVNALQHIPQQPHAQHVALDEWMVMPNHAHVIFEFTDFPAGEGGKRPLSQPSNPFQNAAAGSLGVVVGRYKTAVTKRINQIRHTPGEKVWQRGYYERIIRTEQELHATKEYIRNNPVRWAEDRENLEVLLAKMTYHP